MSSDEKRAYARSKRVQRPSRSVEDAAGHLRIDVETFKAREALNHPTVRWRP